MRLANATLLGLVLSATACSLAEPPGDQNLSTPSSVALRFMRALDAGNAEVAEAMALDDLDDVMLIEGIVGNIRAHRMLAGAAVVKFGPSGRSLGGFWAQPELEASVKLATVSEKGDTATVRNETRLLFLTLKKIEGHWRVDLAASSPRKPIAQARLLEAAGNAAISVADEIDSGKVKTFDEARVSLRRHGYSHVELPTSRPSPADGHAD